MELSSQSQSFFAAGNTNIDAAHEIDQFDYDEDGSYNIEERVAGTCVWSAEEECLLEGLADVPSVDQQIAVVGSSQSQQSPGVVVPEQSQAPIFSTAEGVTPLEATLNTRIPDPGYEFNYESAITINSNVDFSLGISPWYAQTVQARAENGAYCMTLPAGPTQVFESIAIYDNPTFELIQGKRYSIEFDVRSNRNTIVSAAMTIASPHVTYINQHVSVSTEWQSIIVPYEHFVPTIGRVGLGFGAIIPPENDTTYCFDNISLLQEQ